MIGNDVIDLKAAKKESNWRRKGFLQKLFTETEQDYILHSENPFLSVWLFWSMKEAFFKAQESSIHNEQLKRTHFQNCELNQANCLSSYLVGQDREEYQIALYHPFLAIDDESAESAVEVNSVELNNGRLETSLQSQKLEWQGFLRSVVKLSV